MRECICEIDILRRRDKIVSRKKGLGLGLGFRVRVRVRVEGKGEG